MVTIDNAPAMREWADRAHGAGRRIGFVPTMGYLHEGHLSLVRRARQGCDACVVSIFVNPMQFGANEDFERYPSDAETDSARLREAGVDVLYRPRGDEMYQQGSQTEVSVTEVTKGLCGRSRPGHFRGVTTVVAKLFNTVKPDVAIFGEKDFQQLATIRRMVRDLDYGIEIVGMPIVREPDGLAMSSRNAHLSTRERCAARCLSRALSAARDTVDKGERHAPAILDRVRAVLEAEPLTRVDYAELVDASTIEPLTDIDRPALLALAVFVGETRLIDNAILARGG